MYGGNANFECTFKLGQQCLPRTKSKQMGETCVNEAIVAPKTENELVDQFETSSLTQERRLHYSLNP